MPIYEYAPVAGSCAQCAGRFELWERLSDPETTACPHCGQPVRRLVSAPNLATGSAHVLKESHFAERGFTQYRKVAKGQYEKTAGPGPDRIDGGE